MLNHHLFWEELLSRYTLRVYREILLIYVCAFLPFVFLVGYGNWLFYVLIIAYLFTFYVRKIKGEFYAQNLKDNLCYVNVSRPEST